MPMVKDPRAIVNTQSAEYLERMNEQMRYGEIVKAALEDRGMNQKDLSRITGWSETVVSDLVKGKRATFPPEIVLPIAKILDIPVRQQLQVLGYLEPDEVEPGVAYVVREDDPRAALLAVLEGRSTDEIERVTTLASLAFQFGTRGREAGKERPTG